MIWNCIFLFYLILVSAALALLEIQIEGANGWAKALPTWRIENRWTRRLIGEKPLTGYHFHLITFTILLAHVPYFLEQVKPSLSGELKLFSFLIILFILEDFMWFVFNPAFGIKKFKPQYIWWHATSWWWIMPRDYYVSGSIAISLYILSELI